MVTKTITALTRFSVLRFSGEKTQEFLQGQLTCDIPSLSEHGQHSLAACCDHRGRMFANFWVVNWHSDFLFILPKNLSDIVKNHLQKYAVFSKVSISAEDTFFIAELHQTATTPLSLVAIEARAPASRAATNNKSNVIYILLPNINRYLILAESNPFPNIRINHDETIWKKNNIADQLAILCDKTSLLFTPQMINLEKLGGVSFTKGCYVGQEIVARTQHLGTLKRHLHQLTVKNNGDLFPGDDLKNQKGDVIGVIVESVSLDDHMFDVLAVIEDRYQ